jgi:hypothetical protein
MATEEMFPEYRPNAQQKRLQRAAQQVMGYLTDGQVRSAGDVAHAMDTVLGRWMDQRFMRSGVPAEKAEELTQEVWCKLLAGKHVAHTNAFALICRVFHHELIDHFRREKLLKNQSNGNREGGQAEIQGDDDFWEFIQETVGDIHLSDIDAFELRDCLTKQFHRFNIQHPGKFHYFLYLAEGLKYEDIAFIEFKECTEQVAPTFTQRVRGRVEEARKKARAFFAECRD